jgi:hypothetical protein
MTTENSMDFVLNRFNGYFGSYLDNVYLLESDGFYKLGRAVNIPRRISDEQTGNPHEIKLAEFFSGPHDYCYAFEQTWHKRLADFRRRGEWFHLPPVVLEELTAEIRNRRMLFKSIITVIRSGGKPTVWNVLFTELLRPVKYQVVDGVAKEIPAK